MIKIYDDNGLPFFDAAWIRDRRYAEQVLSDTMQGVLRGVNPAWQFEQTEAPCLMPEAMLNPEYSGDDVFLSWSAEARDDVMVLKPETTASSYAYARYLLEHQQAKPPLCVYQASKSFRRENDQATKNVRLKEFYQMEFQCIVTDDTKMDYQASNLLLDEIVYAVERLTSKTARRVDSDRLPSYSERTIDIEVCIRGVNEDTGAYNDTKDKWLEVCSISKRHDVPFSWLAPTGKKWPVGITPESPQGGDLLKNKKLINYEFAFGLDRLVYAMNQ